MRQPLLLCLSTWMLVGGVQMAYAQREAPSRGSIRAGRAENRAQGAQGRGGRTGAAGPRGGRGGANTGGNAGGNMGGTGGQGQMSLQGQGAAQSQDGGGQPDATSASQSRVAALRALMNAAGITEVATQDPIIGFIFKQERARQPLLALARQAIAQINQTAGTQAGGLTAVATDPNAAPGEANKEVIDDDPGLSKYQEYANAIEGDTARYNADLQKLDEIIGYSKKPRLEAFLSLIGVLNNDAYGFGGPAAIFAPGPDTALAQPQGGQAPGANPTP